MLRAATEADLEMIRQWRNHPVVRGASIMTAEITADGHRQWFSRMRVATNAHVLVYEHRGEPAGVVIVKDHDPVTGTAEWGFFLDVDRLRPAGTLTSAWIGLERAAVAYAFDQLGVRTLGGRTLAWNASVLELHRRTGFVEIPERRYTVEIDGAPQEVRWTEMSAEEWRSRN